MESPLRESVQETCYSSYSYSNHAETSCFPVKIFPVPVLHLSSDLPTGTTGALLQSQGEFLNETLDVFLLWCSRLPKDAHVQHHSPSLLVKSLFMIILIPTTFCTISIHFSTPHLWHSVHDHIYDHLHLTSFLESCNPVPCPHPNNT